MNICLGCIEMLSQCMHFVKGKNNKKGRLKVVPFFFLRKVSKYIHPHKKMPQRFRPCGTSPTQHDNDHLRH